MFSSHEAPDQKKSSKWPTHCASQAAQTALRRIRLDLLAWRRPDDGELPPFVRMTESPSKSVPEVGKSKLPHPRRRNRNLDLSPRHKPRRGQQIAGPAVQILAHEILEEDAVAVHWS